MKNKNIKISFLIPVHNEEKIIGKTLENLLRLPYDNYEVILGLDGCTDKSEEIVKKFCKKSRKFKYYKLNLRQGKPAVIDNIINKARGKIIIINDADWIFKVKDRDSLKKFISVFNDKEIGGIAESFPVEWNENREKGNLGYKMVAYSSFFWLNFQKKKLTHKKSNLIYLKKPTMFLTNIFRKELYKKNFSLGDDFERTENIMNSNYKIVLFDNIEMPRMTAVYDKILIKDLFRQKKRTAIAREQLKKQQEVNFENYYLPAIKDILKNSFKQGIKIGALVSLWIFLTLIATIASKFKKISTKEGWKLRAR